MKYHFLAITAAMLLAACGTKTTTVQTASQAPQAQYAAQVINNNLSKIDRGYKISISQALGASGAQLPAEGFTITRKGKHINIQGNDASGMIYGANRLLEQITTYGTLADMPATITDAPEMKLRGTCVGLQKTYYLPGHKVYEYPYTPENFPWFYDKDLWIKYLDMLAADNMNTLYLWNGHPFSSLVKLKDYPYAVEVDDKTMELNQQMFTFLTTEAQRRGIRVIQMFYNILLPKPFADKHGLKTQDRNAPITPLVSDYTRKSIAAFIEKYPNVGFLVCLGEAMATIDDDVEWMTKTIIPGIKDGLKASGRNDIPPIILRAHDTDGPRVLRESLPYYPNIYTMSKYTGESLTTYEPQGPWAETHRQLSAAAPIHISNVHVLANLEPFRWSSPAFTQKAVQAMHRAHGANGLHLYPQANYWDWPYTADKMADGTRQLQIDRDWMWYQAWGRYAWNSNRGTDRTYWQNTLAQYYGTDTLTASYIIDALDESGEIAPKLLRRFGITEGNRQTLLLGMKMSQQVNPYKYTIYPGFYESCGPQGEKLIEYIEKEYKGEAHHGELPYDIVDQCVAHGDKGVAAISKAQAGITRNGDEFKRLLNDMRCYQAFAKSFRTKVQAAGEVLRYKWTQDVSHLHRAIPLLEQSDREYRHLVDLTKDTYLYANSMQTAQRRIPIGGNDGKYKTWAEMMPVYEDELNNLKANTWRLEHPELTAAATTVKPQRLTDAILDGTVTVQRINGRQLSGKKNDPALLSLKKGVRLFEQREEQVDTVAPELAGITALLMNRDSTRVVGGVVEFTTTKPVKMLVGFYIDDQNKFAAPPKLEIDATGNEYGQAEAVYSHALASTGMPMADVHAYHLPAGHHVLRLPKGIISVLGFTTSDMHPRDASLAGSSVEVDWLFMK